MKEALSRKKEAHKEICIDSTENNRYMGIRSKAQKAVREKTEYRLTKLKNYPGGMFSLVKKLIKMLKCNNT